MMSALARVVVRRTARRVVRVVRASLPVFALVPANAVRRAAIAIDGSNPIQIKSNQSRVTSRVAVWRRGRGRARTGHITAHSHPSMRDERASRRSLKIIEDSA
jgi:hypothetical protein